MAGSMVSAFHRGGSLTESYFKETSFSSEFQVTVPPSHVQRSHSKNLKLLVTSHLKSRVSHMRAHMLLLS